MKRQKANPDQRDDQSLPPYEVLDAILEGLVENEMRVSDLVAKGFDLETVKKIERLLYGAEYKRRQSAPGVKVTLKVIEGQLPLRQLKLTGVGAAPVNGSVSPGKSVELFVPKDR